MSLAWFIHSSLAASTRSQNLLLFHPQEHLYWSATLAPTYWDTCPKGSTLSFNLWNSVCSFSHFSHTAILQKELPFIYNKIHENKKVPPHGGTFYSFN